MLMGSWHDTPLRDIHTNTRRSFSPWLTVKKNSGRSMVTGSINSIPMVAMCRKNRQDLFNPFAIVDMGYSVDMGKEVGIMPVG